MLLSHTKYCLIEEPWPVTESPVVPLTSPPQASVSPPGVVAADSCPAPAPPPDLICPPASVPRPPAVAVCDHRALLQGILASVAVAVVVLVKMCMVWHHNVVRLCRSQHLCLLCLCILY